MLLRTSSARRWQESYVIRVHSAMGRTVASNQLQPGEFWDKHSRKDRSKHSRSHDCTAPAVLQGIVVMRIHACCGGDNYRKLTDLKEHTLQFCLC